jgi:hypothetical protein
MRSQEAVARGIRIRRAKNGAWATMETRVALIVAERGLTKKQLAKYWVRRRKNSKPQFDHWRFAADQGISPDWLFEGDIRAHPRGPAASEEQEHAEWMEIGEIVGKLDQRSMTEALAFLRRLTGGDAA